MTVTELGLPSLFRPAEPAPADGPLVDTYGRVATDLRVSLTDRCNLRCTYCMPAEGLDWMPGEQLLELDELNRLLRIAVTRLGITRVRFTGGEPLVARHLEDVVAAAAALRPRPEIALTTNGIGLDRRAAGLKRAGLDRINVSLDTVDPQHFARITRRDRLADVLHTIHLADSVTRMAGNLSHGQKQWLEIGMLLMQDPKLLLLDEPVAGMTDEETARTAELFLTLKGQHSLMVVEHDMSFIRTISEIVTVLCDGAVLAQGTLDQVQADERVIEVYLGR